MINSTTTSNFNSPSSFKSNLFKLIFSSPYLTYNPNLPRCNLISFFSYLPSIFGYDSNSNACFRVIVSKLNGDLIGAIFSFVFPVSIKTTGPYFLRVATTSLPDSGSLPIILLLSSIILIEFLSKLVTIL